jgi:hypothetical protein
MIDLKFIEFYIRAMYDKSVQDYFHVNKSTVSMWRSRNMPDKYKSTFIDLEKSDDIQKLFNRIYGI